MTSTAGDGDAKRTEWADKWDEGVERGQEIGYAHALAAILDCHTRIVARHVPSPRVRRVRAGYRDRSLRASLALRSERR